MHEIDYGTFCPDDEPLSETGEELIARILPAKSLTILTGKAGTGKSFFAAGIAVAVSSGSDYLGFKNRNPGVPLGVAYLAAKGQGCFEERIVAAARVNRSKWPLQIFTLTGNLTLNSSQARQACVAALRREFEKIRETTGVAPGLVIVDALAGAMSERAVETMKAFRQMKNELGVAMLVIEDLDSGPSDAYNYETMADHALCLLAKRDEDWLVTDRRLVGPTGPLCNLDIIAPNGLGLNCYGEPREIGVLVRDWSKDEKCMHNWEGLGVLLLSATLDRNVAKVAMEGATEIAVLADDPCVTSFLIKHDELPEVYSDTPPRYVVVLETNDKGETKRLRFERYER